MKQSFKTFMTLLICLPALANDDGLEHVNFPLNSHVVVDSFQSLNLLAEVMVKYPDLELVVVGYTDSIASDAYNKNLSMRRANNVKAYLVSKGAQDGKISIEGRGESNFVENNDSREGRFLNRRVELNLYEMVDGQRKLVGYKRLIALFFGDSATAAAGDDSHDLILAKLSDLEKRQAELKDALEKKMEAATPQQGQQNMTEDKKSSWSSASVSGNLQFNGFSGVSFDLGVDNEDDLTARIKGQYFKAVTDKFGVQAQGEYTYYDSTQESQFDGALIYQKGHFKIGGAASYKFISIDGFDSAAVGQGALVADLVFNKGKIGLFGTAPFGDGDVIGSQMQNFSFLQETYVEVARQLGLSFGINFGEKASLSGSLASLDTDADSDLAINLRFELNIHDNFTWYIDLDRNDSYLGEDDGERYATGLRWGSWAQARYMAADQVTPIDIPSIKYELKVRQSRVGNTAPIADAGPNQTDVPAGTVTLSGSATDADGDDVTFSWTQIAGDPVQIQNDDQATATFEGEAGKGYSFMLTARDSFGTTGSDVVSIFMEEAPVEILEPSIRFFSAVPSTIDEGEFTTLSWSTNYGDTVTIEGLGQVNAEGSLIVSPDVSTSYTLTVSNEAGTVASTVEVTVVPVDNTPNTAPLANAGADQYNQFAGTVMLDGSGSFDPDGDQLTYQWVQINGQTVELSGADTAQPTFTSELTRAYTFKLIVTDGKGGIDSDEVTILVGTSP